MILNLDTTFSPYGKVNSIAFKSFTFSGGEPHIKLLTDLSAVSEVTITIRVTAFNDMGFLLLAVDALRREGIGVLHLVLPYMPAARQDRVMVSGESLSVKVYADIINAQNFKSVTVYDPHSEVTPALVNNCKVITNHSFLNQVVKTISTDLVLVSPDGGALKKIYKVSESLGGLPVVECSKKRNVTNGKLESFMVYEDGLEGKDCLIVDDICDGGGTFMGLAEALKAKGAGALYLAVSHGIFSKGFKDLQQHFTKIFTTDSFKTIEEENGIEQIPLSKLLK